MSATESGTAAEAVADDAGVEAGLRRRGRPAWGRPGWELPAWSAQAGTGLLLAAAAASAVLAVLWHAGNGWDQVDESFYLRSAAPPRPDDAYNGLWGFYLRPWWAALHWDVAAVRVTGLAGLVVAAVILGRATAVLLGRRPAPVVAATVAGAAGFYTPLLRTPSYNWFAVVGAGLACAACLRLLARGPSRWGALAGPGVALAAAGKVTTGGVLAVLVVAVAVGARRPRALGWAAAAFAVPVVLHLTLVLSPGDTLRVLRRSAAHLAVFDPEHYTLAGALTSTAIGVVLCVALSTATGGVAGLLPLAAAPSGPSRAARIRVLTVAALILATADAVWTRTWAAAHDRTDRFGTGLVALLVATLIAALIGRRFATAGPMPRRPLAAALLLVLAALGCVAGTNVDLGFMLAMTGLLLAPACLLAAEAAPACALPATTWALAGCIVAGSLLTAAQTYARPKWEAPLTASDTPVRLGPVTVRVDAGTAARVADLRSRAARAGWRPGTPLLDGAFIPTVSLALGADVPPVLLPSLPQSDPRALCEAVRGLGAAWEQAWLLLPPARTEAERALIAGYLGRVYPRDYALVTDYRDPFSGFEGVLLRPAGASTPPSSDQASARAAAGSCLGPG